MKNVHNMTLRLFDAIGVHQIELDKRLGSNQDDHEELPRTDKTGLRQDYSMPNILGEDIFETCQVRIIQSFLKTFQPYN